MLLSITQHARASSSPLNDMNASGCVVSFTDTIKLLGTTIDFHLTFDSHVQNVCMSAYYNIRALKHIRSSLSTDMASTYASTLVNSRLDYANSAHASSGICRNCSEFRTDSPASLHTQNVWSIFDRYINIILLSMDYLTNTIHATKGFKSAW